MTAIGNGNAAANVKPVTKPMRTMRIAIRAEDARRLDGEVWELDIPARELSDQELRMLDELFPHSQTIVGQLLDKEALINALVKREHE